MITRAQFTGLSLTLLSVSGCSAFGPATNAPADMREVATRRIATDEQGFAKTDKDGNFIYEAPRGDSGLYMQNDPGLGTTTVYLKDPKTGTISAYDKTGRFLGTVQTGLNALGTLGGLSYDAAAVKGAFWPSAAASAVAPAPVAPAPAPARPFQGGGYSAPIPYDPKQNQLHRFHFGS